MNNNVSGLFKGGLIVNRNFVLAGIACLGFQVLTYRSRLNAEISFIILKPTMVDRHLIGKINSNKAALALYFTKVMMSIV